MKKYLLISLLVAVASKLCAQVPSLPTWYISAYNQQHLNERYEIKGFIKPAYVKADFNGDGAEDIAALIIEKKTRKKGILLILNKTFQYSVFGAGVKVGKIGFDDTDDLKWLGRWKVYTKKTAYETKFDNGDIVGSTKRKLANKGISIWSLEDGEPLAGGIIYWTGKKWDWIHQGE